MFNTCSKCKLDFPQTDFIKSTVTKSGYRSVCRECHNSYYRKRRVEKYELVRSYEQKYHKQRRLKYEYNITEAQLKKLHIDQNNKCGICFSETKLVIDHCHTTGKVRGLLCSPCNIGLGHFKDNVTKLGNAIKYLEK